MGCDIHLRLEVKDNDGNIIVYSTKRPFLSFNHKDIFSNSHVADFLSIEHSALREPKLRGWKVNLETGMVVRYKNNIKGGIDWTESMGVFSISMLKLYFNTTTEDKAIWYWYNEVMMMTKEVENVIDNSEIIKKSINRSPELFI